VGLRPAAQVVRPMRRNGFVRPRGDTRAVRQRLGRAVLVLAEVGALIALVIVAGLVVVTELIRYRAAQNGRRRARGASPRTSANS
jgi:hypothetical protein